MNDDQNPIGHQVTAYGGRHKYWASGFQIEVEGGRKFHIAHCQCAKCKYEFFFPAKPEHEPRFCPQCAIEFRGCTEGLSAEES